MREYRKVATGQRGGENETVPAPERQVEHITAFEAINYPGKPIGLGASGENVHTMQQYLSVLAATYQIPLITADGEYGEHTQGCVRAFQQLVGLNVDGIIGADTWKAVSDSYWNLANREALISAMGRAIVGKMFMS